MSVPIDFAYLDHLLAIGLVAGEVLEIGSRDWPESEGAARDHVVRAGLPFTGADLEDGPGVDTLLDVLDADATAALGRTWDSVLLFNLLEHVYDPVGAMTNALRLVGPGGSLVVAGPTIWQLHDYPADYWRPLPDFFLEFAARNRCRVDERGLTWLLHDRLVPVRTLVDGDQKLLPSKLIGDRVWGGGRTRWSRLAHRALHTLGRELYFPYVGLGVVLVREDDDQPA